MDDFFTFSGHSHTELAIWVKKLEIWLNLSQGGGGSLFEHGQLSMILFWLTLNMEPPLHCLIFFQISNFLISLAFSMSKWPEKNIILFENFYSASEKLKRIEIYKVISGKMAISENGFGHFKAK